MEGTKTSKNNGIIIFLIVALCISIGVIVYLYMSQGQQKCAECEKCVECAPCETDASNDATEPPQDETIGSYPNLYTTNPTKENIITLFDRYLHVKGFIYEPNLTEIKYDKVTYLGYENNIRYYKVSGSYTCVATGVECYYSPQGNDPVYGSTYELDSGILVVEVTNNDEMYTLKDMVSGLPNSNYTQVNQEIN